MSADPAPVRQRPQWLPLLLTFSAIGVVVALFWVNRYTYRDCEGAPGWAECVRIDRWTGDVRYVQSVQQREQVQMYDDGDVSTVPGTDTVSQPIVVP